MRTVLLAALDKWWLRTQPDASQTPMRPDDSKHETPQPDVWDCVKPLVNWMLFLENSEYRDQVAVILAERGLYKKLKCNIENEVEFSYLICELRVILLHWFISVPWDDIKHWILIPSIRKVSFNSFKNITSHGQCTQELWGRYTMRFYVCQHNIHSAAHGWRCNFDF